MAKLKNYKNIIRLAIPIILANASAPLLGLADTATIGQTAHAAELGAISLAALVFSFVYWGFGFLRMGTTGFIAQAKGKSDPDEVLAVLFRSVILGLGIGVLMILLQYFIGSAALWMLSASEEVKLLVADYFYIRIYGAPATLITYSILGSLIGLGLTKELMWVQFALN
ncbi:MAG TPA: MATE family efflux transporter, partial [Flavobacteriaceae bacterium]|nr:MATE family efflux transporter [Flavobacteriaceae bacterium]